jgi:glycosyltransferase involved in cell wall biosynthesis
VRVVRNGIDLARFTPNTVHGEAVRASLDAAADDVVIVSVGALEPVKGHRLLIEAMAELHRTQPTVKLWLVGEGYLRGELEAQATQLGLQRVVSFLGWRTDVPAVLAAADFSVLASQSEGMPLAAMESMACGRPVVATRVGGLGELIESGVSGVLIAPGNLEELVSALRGLVENAEQRSMLGAAANQRAVEQFSVQAMQASYEAIYRRAITR